MSSDIIFFSDMDDTLIQTRRKTDFDRAVEVGAFNTKGEESSFYYKGTKLFIDKLLDSSITIIPTTARSISSYYRTTLSQDKRIKYAILNFGATILINNKIDTEWENRINNKLNKISMESLLYEIKEILDSELDIKLIDNFYVNIHNKIKFDNSKIKNIVENFLENQDNFYLHHNDNSFAILPTFLNKKFAVEYLIEELNPILTLGAGDNRSDLDFMNIIDFKILPKNILIEIV